MKPPTRCLAALPLTCMAPASAQLRLPLRPPSPGDLGSAVQRTQEALDPRRLIERRGATVRDLLQRHRDVLEADPAGAPAVRGAIVALSPSPAALDAAGARA